MAVLSTARLLSPERDDSGERSAKLFPERVSFSRCAAWERDATLVS